MPVMRVSDYTTDAIEESARPLESRRQVLDRLVRLATQGPPENWLAEVLRNFFDQEDRGDLAAYILSRWPELREPAQRERLGGDPGEEGGGEACCSPCWRNVPRSY